MYADEGHRYKAESQGCVTERRRLVDEIRNAKAAFQSTRPAFQQAKAEFDRAKHNHDQAKAEHLRKQEAFKTAKQDFERAAAAFKQRLEVVRSRKREEAGRKKGTEQMFALIAGVPPQYLGDMIMREELDGTMNFYFGGAGSPDGPGHGHYVMDRSRNVTYKRDPFDPHGSQNFEDAKDASLLYSRSARNGCRPLSTNEHGGVFYRRSDVGGTTLHITQYFADGYRVSWDATPRGSEKIHWTNGKLPKHHPDRHLPPPDAAL